MINDGGDLMETYYVSHIDLITLNLFTHLIVSKTL